ncbi:hypothetical protein CANARDRAFT_5937 [[Candida] arabinofermentans NRRL YB-2248]|uniref:Choline/carnitine acyltransferase domain-containing protein n=1 Tax=[Candida] arabinofermentans NRRL YB-2248 TaxID=983967 RepID=A0A1E4T6K9_9ASCO|nr:hypothetical protein CANARDRAFT_5937 [[Candida] arabinofermentans NRRL YB-2248]
MSTFEYQKDLKKLPIPPLEDTITRYLRCLKPLQTEHEYKQTVESCEQFLKSSGPILQQQLIDYAKSRDSYIEQFWYDSYLNYDSPVVLNLNPFIMLEDDPTPLKSTQLSRAASLSTSSLRFLRALRKQELNPDLLKNGKPLDMDQYPKLFGSSRIPTQTGCILQTDAQSRHIVVLSRSQFYWFDVLDENNDLILTENDIKLNLQSIIEDSETTSLSDVAKSSFGVLTTENRRIWATLRSKISKDDINNEILKIVDNALFIVVLDHVEVGDDLTRMSKNFLCGESILENGVQVGTCTNRWYDKLQLIVTKDAKVGINFEHTGVDGHTVLRFASDIYTDSILRFARTINNNSPSLWKTSSPDPSTRDPSTFGNVITTPRKLEWNLTNELSLALRFGETRLSDLINQNEFSTLEFKSYGMERIKKMGMSPDAYVQMCFQLAYYALYGKIESTYEPAMTKMFLHGRTEAIRTVSLQSNEFVTKFLDENLDAKEKIQILKDACKQHSLITREASQGLGQDRHLYALFCIWKRYFSEGINGNSDDDSISDDATTINFNDLPSSVKDVSELREIPSIFADAGWDKLNNTIISTSNCGNPSLKLFGFGPVSANGFGLGYIIKDNSITICASSKHRQTKRFMDTLNSSLLEVERTFTESTRPAVSVEKESFNNELNNEDIIERLNEIRSRRGKSEIIRLLGGYDSFEIDANSDFIKSREHSQEPPFSRHSSKIFTNREIGKKLRLAEY